ncbi:MAG: hypothetical protein WC050_03310 [Candidatus Paceibacterota bacterium]
MSTHFKYILAFSAVFLFRLLPFRAPNVEPILATVMPLSKRFGALSGIFFAVSSIVLYDAVTSGLGVWTLVTGFAYALVAALSYAYFKKRPATRRHFALFSVFAVLLYDALTGLSVGPLQYGQSLSSALAGQVPFTVLHLLGAVLFALVVSPALYRWFSAEAIASAPAIARA